MNRPRVKRIDVSWSRPNEYTHWRPRREQGNDWTTYGWGCFRVIVERAPIPEFGPACPNNPFADGPAPTDAQLAAHMQANTDWTAPGGLD